MARGAHGRLLLTVKWVSSLQDVSFLVDRLVADFGLMVVLQRWCGKKDERAKSACGRTQTPSFVTEGRTWIEITRTRIWTKQSDIWLVKYGQDCHGTRFKS